MAGVPGSVRLSIHGLGWGLSAALIMLFVVSMLAALFLSLRPALGYVMLFSDAPVGSQRIWIDGIVVSLAIGWIIAVVLGTVYNVIVAWRSVHS